MNTVTLQQIQEQTGLSRQSIYKKASNGELKRVGKNKYTVESANALIEKQTAKHETIAPTKTGVTKEKLALLEEIGVIEPDKHGRYTESDIALAKKLHVSHRQDGRIILSVKRNEPQKEISLAEMERQSGIKKPTLLHYVRSGKIEKTGDNTYSEKSFKKFIKDYDNLRKKSLVKAQIMEQLDINNDEYLDLLHAHKFEKASFERYTQKSIDILKGMPKNKWMTEAPTYKGIPVQHTYSGRELPDDEVMTYKEVKEALNREKSTIVHLVKEGKIELVGRNRYAKDTVMKYLAERDKDKEQKEPEYYTAKEVKKLLGIGSGTHLSYYLKKGMFSKAGNNQYLKEEVDNYINSKKK